MNKRAKLTDRDLVDEIIDLRKRLAEAERQRDNALDYLREKRMWSHVKIINRRRQGRDYVMTFVGFKSLEEITQYTDEVKRTDYVYFPSFYNERQDEDGTWSVDHRRADSCD
jgi:hypothetical protein